MRLFAIIILFLFASCGTLSVVNKELDARSQQAIRESPFKAAPKATSDIFVQKKVRQIYLDEISRMRKANPSDTIVLTEFYTFDCLGCQALYVDIQTPASVKLYDKTATGSYVLKKEIFAAKKRSEFDLYTFQVQEIFSGLRKGKDWNKDPKHYGDEKCKDGSHTIYSVFFPDGRIESMYVRCWTLRPGGAGHW